MHHSKFAAQLHNAVSSLTKRQRALACFGLQQKFDKGFWIVYEARKVEVQYLIDTGQAKTVYDCPEFRDMMNWVLLHHYQEIEAADLKFWKDNQAKALMTDLIRIGSDLKIALTA